MPLKLLVVSTNPDSQTNAMRSVPFFNIGTLEEWLVFWKALADVLIGQDMAMGPLQRMAS
jgi:hypothetical protein